MTLVLAIPALDGVVFASDGQITLGQVRWQEKKIKQLNSKCLWSASGELALIQRMEEAIQKLPNKNQPLSNIRDQLSDVIKQTISLLLQQDFRTQFFQPKPDALLKLHPGDFMFAEWRERPRILHLLSNGTNEWINKPFALGSGSLFAYALLQKYQEHNFGIQKASLLAYKVLEESIRVGSWGIDFPIDIWQINNKCTKNLNEDEIAALEDSSRALREAEVKLFLE